MNKKRWILAGVVGIALVVCLALYQVIFSRVNIRPFLGSGGTAALEIPPGFEAQVFA
jgi:hypothetical protein